jgi:hypothetical protein
MITLHCVPHNKKKITQFISPPVLLLKKKLFIIAPRVERDNRTPRGA